MKRALLLARNGEGRVSPNPMVGAVVVHDGLIIGEGFHAVYGGPHAEVNAINSVKPHLRHLLKDSQIYVTLEPCAHHGKTPPCANLIVATGIPEVVVGALDPNPLVAGKGIEIMNDAGVKVVSGVLEEECKYLNRRFMFAQVSPFPYITLKWAQSADGFMATFDADGLPSPVKLSTRMSSVWVHRERAAYDAIMVGGNTERIDHPQLNVRLWGGNSPKKFVAHGDCDLQQTLLEMRKSGVTSLLVEGGPTLLNFFLKNGWWDELRIETSPSLLINGLKSPQLPDNKVLVNSFKSRGNLIETFENPLQKKC